MLKDKIIHYKAGFTKVLKVKTSTCVDCGCEVYSYTTKKQRCVPCNKIRRRETSKVQQKRYVELYPERVKRTKTAYYERNKELVKMRAKKFKLENADHIKKQLKEYHEKNKEYIKERRKIYRQKNIEWLTEKSKIYYEKNKEARSKYHKAWREKNRGLSNALSKEAKLSRLKRTPSWFEKNEIKEIYKDCPTGYQVDHIIPLRGKNVSGLHVASNLQYLTEKENHVKRNKFKEEYLFINAKKQRENTLKKLGENYVR